ncbi:MAG: hypothetical protein SVM80_01700 [Halobacteriota archaeon]|nr:hypothetical protein [Halobacteriota archaeon]
MEEALIIVIIFVSTVSSMALAAMILSRRSRQKWQKLADELGLAFEGGRYLFRDSKIRGLYRKRSVLFRIYMESRTLYTQLTLNFENTKNVSLFIYYKKTFDKVGKLLGGEIKFEENPEFDSKITVRGSDKDLIKAVIDQSIQDRILGLDKFDILRIKEEKAYFREVGIITDTERLKTVIGLVSDIVDGIEED